jgi:YbbR domain-containing protein
VRSVSELLKSLRLSLTDNLGLKMSALLLAVLMFSLVHGAEDMERSIYVDVVVEPPPDAEDMLLVSEIPDRVRLRLRGSRSRLNALRQDDVHPVEVRLKSTSEPSYYFEEEQFDMPAGIEVTQVTPSSFDFHWVKQAERDVPVEVSLSGELKEGLEWGGPAEVVPTLVKVQGPRDVVNAIRQVRTTDIDVSNLGIGVMQRDVPLIGPPSHTKFDSQTALVTLRVELEMKERALSAMSVEVEGGPVRSLRPRRVAVRLRGPAALVDELDPSLLRVVADVSRALEEKGPVVVPLSLEGLPTGIEVIELNPAQVTAQLGS